MASDDGGRGFVLRPGAPYGRILAYWLPCQTLGRHPGAGPDLGGDVHDRRWLFHNGLVQ